ncbi:MAG: hypothetical protein MRZ79_13495 [Bacteroidia bacterium]|nr:hypothetical protein [Bacteroidia bacterium]
MNSNQLDDQIREAQLKKLAIEIETLEAERREALREEEAQLEEMNRPWWRKVNFYRFGAAIAVFFPIAWFYLFEVIGPSLELQQINRELQMTQLTVQIDTLGKKIDEDLAELENRNSQQLHERALLVEAQRQELSKIDSLLEMTEDELKNLKAELRSLGDSSFEGSIDRLITSWSKFYTPSRKNVEEIQLKFAEYIKQRARRMGGKYEEEDSEVDGVKKFYISDLHNVIFPDDKKNTERVTIEMIVEALNNVYTVRTAVNVEYSKNNKADSKKLGDIPRKNARLAIQKLEFQDDFKNDIRKDLGKRIKDLEVKFE